MSNERRLVVLDGRTEMTITRSEEEGYAATLITEYTELALTTEDAVAVAEELYRLAGVVRVNHEPTLNVVHPPGARLGFNHDGGIRR